ncbi:phosphotransferase family protein [Candidatus Acetothermia bacterium]|nr:phosphotransferase family protein [Candidatus Acetothermia bacterium]
MGIDRANWLQSTLTVQQGLEAYFCQRFSNYQEIQIKNLASITAGWENEMYAFDVEYESGGTHRHEELVLRIYPGVDAHTKSAQEFHSLQQLYRIGYPVPKIMLVERENSPFGKPFLIMERIKGQLLGALLFHSPDQNQPSLLKLFCELFVRLHRLDWQPFVEREKHAEFRKPYYFVDQWLRTAHDYLNRYEMTDFLPVIQWLEQRRDQVPCARPSVVHGDFHPFNMLVREDGSAVVIDWTGCRVTDARFDLAWTLMLASAYHGVEWRQHILKEYERVAKANIDRIEYFEVCAYARRLFDISVSLSQGPDKLGMRPAAADMMKQEMHAAKRVYEYLLERTEIRVPTIEKMLSKETA